MASNQHEVSVRSRNQYSVVGDSGEVIQIEASGALPPTCPGAGLQKPGSPWCDGRGE